MIQHVLLLSATTADLRAATFAEELAHVLRMTSPSVDAQIRDEVLAIGHRARAERDLVVRAAKVIGEAQSAIAAAQAQAPPINESPGAAARRRLSQQLATQFGSKGFSPPSGTSGW
jgi:hypothetical protein